MCSGTLSERLRRQIRNLLGFARAGSNPAGVVVFSFTYMTKLSCNGSMAEWSKALDSSSSLFGGVGSNPTWTTLFYTYSDNSFWAYSISFSSPNCSFYTLNASHFFQNKKRCIVRHPGVEPGSQRWERWMITATPMALYLISDFNFSNPFL